MNHVCRCMKISKITDEFISKTKDHAYETTLLWRELELNVTPSAHLF